MKRHQITFIGLETSRTGPDAVLRQFQTLLPRAVMDTNAESGGDIDIAVLALLRPASQGKRYVFRTGAAFASARLGIKPIPPISVARLNLSLEAGVLIIAGPYVPKTTAQLEIF